MPVAILRRVRDRFEMFTTKLRRTRERFMSVTILQRVRDGFETLLKKLKSFETGLSFPWQYWERFETSLKGFATKLRRVWDAHNKSKESRPVSEPLENVKNDLRYDWCLQQNWDAFETSSRKFVAQIFWICAKFKTASFCDSRAETVSDSRHFGDSLGRRLAASAQREAFVFSRAALRLITTPDFTFLYSFA